MTTHRPERVADLIREVLSGIIRREIRDPRVGPVTLTDVRVSPDLREARVYVTPLGDPHRGAEVAAALDRAAAFLRRALGKQVRLRYVPALTFVQDDALETGTRVDDLLREISREREARESEAEPEPGAPTESDHDGGS